MAKQYKMKSKRSAAKRFSFTASGRVKRKSAGLRHFMRRKNQRAKRNLRQRSYVSKADTATIKTLLPYG